MMYFSSLCIAFALAWSGSQALLPINANTSVRPGTSSIAQQGQDDHKVQYLKRLVEAAEKALSNKDEATAVERMDEAEVYIADWSIDLLSREDSIALLEQMSAIRKKLGDDTEDSGIKSEEEIDSLSEDALKRELELVKAAEVDADFDFPIDLNDKVLTFVSAFSGRSKNTIQNSLSRGSKYMPMILEVLAEEGIPLDLAFLPVIESGFRNEARSRAAAVGMWQFISATGRTYGLRIDNWVDERRDPTKATRAAARFLKDLYERNEDWYLALAGYNAGPGRVNGAIQGTGSRNFWDHARSKHLRVETKNYVPQFCAAVLIGKSPEAYGLEILQLEPYVYETVEVEKSISLISLAVRAGIDPELLRELNPELVRRTTPPRQYGLKVPVGSAASVLGVLAAMPATERLEFRAYKIKKGDTLAGVSKRYNTSPDELLAINNITSSQFRIGRNIQVPVVVKVSAPAQKRFP
jgi:membrane-bound lytic murein transglycosylase D